MIKHRYLVLFFIFFQTLSYTQAPSKWNSIEIYEAIEKLNFLGSALYIAAHPDDENTKLISYLSNKVKARTAYLSLTRGDGGQNLIGPEIREMLGVIRTQELVTARNIDGGSQLFTRANDFGYSKHPKETLQIWNKDSVLGDVVWAIRNFKPDIIVNRFDHRTPGATHGHHTSSAMLSVEAFDLAGDASKFPSQLKYVTSWQPKRTFFNTSWWFYGSEENFKKADKSRLLDVDTGVYFPIKGISNSEIAALSRSQHKSQGFGALGTRGSLTEYLELVKGDLPKDKNNLFEGIDTSWNRIKKGKEIQVLLDQILQEYDFTNPSASTANLIEVYKKIQNLEDQHWKQVKLEEIKDIILAVSGIYLEASTTTAFTTPSATLPIQIEAINRSSTPVVLSSIIIPAINYKEQVNKKLEDNRTENIEVSGKLMANLSYTTPYWLKTTGSLGMYHVADQKLIGRPETPSQLQVSFELSINNISIPITKQIVYKVKDPVKGEVYQPLEIIPEVTINLKEEVLLFADTLSKKLPVVIRAHKDNMKGEASIKTVGNWKITPDKIAVNIVKKGEDQTVYFTLTPPENQNIAAICPEFKIENTTYTKKINQVTYEHIPNQTVILPSEAKAIKLDIAIKGKEIGYINGAGDVVPESLRQIGYNVTILEPTKLQLNTLKKYDAVITGVRAYNILNELAFKQKVLIQYVKEGGNLIIQYNTSRGLKTNDLGPYPLTLSRDRVTDENATVSILDSEHPALNSPNKITAKDFEGWVQERGLYFPKEWSKEYTALLSMADEGESIKKGSLLVASYGKGNYVYTGLSFFREFPAGVPGAYRLFANLISLGK
ncbi:PIG-L family deacetylase [Aquimarina sp. ERC-38]|uniref:PIG-L family deacetylase n=1 Tax=Aquimarina sp. ERC-38 TaxID=2949996 RepID=UPI002246C9F3|nr:PIG-L family deacetylase [Aquimarina sp. ERC-38]UZO80167.1 PIG-L family deacetylase [Aquimarina sp. ERC-38]